MYVRHFFKMLLGLLFMAVLGIGGLLILNYYSGKAAAVKPAVDGTKTAVPAKIDTAKKK